MQNQADSETHYKEILSTWEKAMKSGLIGGRPFSASTMWVYKHYVEWFLEQYQDISVQNLKKAMLDIDATHFAKRFKLYQALNCFAKYLQDEGHPLADYLEQAKRYKQKRHLPPQKTTVSEPDIEAMIQKADTPLDKTLLILLSATGLRVSEAVGLKIKDINLEDRVLVVRLAKWGKTRRVGISDRLLDILEAYIKVRKPQHEEDVLFLDKKGKPITRFGIRERLEKLGRKAGVKVTPHALRRAFVTINANKGRPLPMLQIACGHSCITTTRSYCMTSEEETIQAMKSWD